MTTTPTVDQLCNVYVKIREKKREMVKKYEEEIALYDGKLDALAGAMKDMLVAAGAPSMKTDHGTVYSQVKTRYYPMDWSVFKTWIVQNDAVDLLEKRVAQTNVKQWLEENPTNPPPGLQAESELTVTVRKN